MATASLIRRCCRAHKALPQIRHLNLQEYQSKGLMDKYGVTIQPFLTATSAEDAAEKAKVMLNERGAEEIVLKAQILAGGRGKGTFSSGLKGGVKLSRDPEEIGKLTSQMIGFNLVTKQTSAEGSPVSNVMVAKALNIVKETYLAIVMDRGFGGPVIVASPDGGVDIEEVAEKTPERVYKVPVDIFTGVTDAMATELAEKLEFSSEVVPAAAAEIKKLYELFTGVDATQVEVNPFGLTDRSEVVCFDAKINFDDNAQFRQRDIFSMEDTSETDPRELEAAKYDLNYIGMDGKVQEEQVEKAFNILTQDPAVKTIFVNIFGGIVDCRVIASGIVSACRKTGLSLPLVVRLQGANMEEARKILDNSGLHIQAHDQFNEAAEAAVKSLEGK